MTMLTPALSLMLAFLMISQVCSCRNKPDPEMEFDKDAWLIDSESLQKRPKMAASLLRQLPAEMNKSEILLLLGEPREATVSFLPKSSLSYCVGPKGEKADFQLLCFDLAEGDVFSHRLVKAGEFIDFED